MKIISFGDKKVIPIYKFLLKSAYKYGYHHKHEFIFYTNDKSITEIKGAQLKHFDIPKVTRRFVFHKPNILLKSIKDFPNETLLYLDVDILLGKRFNPDKILEGKKFDYPLAPHHTLNWETSHRNGVMLTINEALNPGQNSIKWPPMDWEWVQTCCLIYNSSHYDFLFNWKTICYNPANKFTGDEAALNSLFKFKSFENLGKIHINYPNIDASPEQEKIFWEKFNQYEELENHFFMGYQPPSMNTPNTSDIMFYHGCQDLKSLKTL